MDKKTASFNFSNNNSEEFKVFIKDLEERQDEAIGITRSEIIEDGQLITLRDARNMKNSLSEKDKLNSGVYTKMIIVTARTKAVLELLEVEQSIYPNRKIDTEKNREQIIFQYNQQMSMLNEFINNTKANFHNDSKKLYRSMRDFDKSLWLILAANNIDDIDAKLTEMVFWQSSHFESIPLKTVGIVRLEGQEYEKIIIDKPIKPFLVDEQRERFTNGAYRKDDWYLKMNDFQRVNFEKHKKQMIEGNHVLPHKFNYMPGLRNAFERESQIIGKEGAILASNIMVHMANPAVINGGKDSDELASDNLQRISDYNNNNQILPIGLVTPSFLIKEERKIVRDIENNSNKDNNSERSYNLNVPINIFRWLRNARREDELKSYLQDICIALTHNHELILDKSQSVRDMIKQLGFLKDLNLREQKILKQLEKVRELRHNKTLLRSFLNKNLEIKLNSEIHNLTSMIKNNSGDNPELGKLSNTLQILYCKSGKDRTQIQTENTDSVILAGQLKDRGIVQSNKGLTQEILKQSLNERHAYAVNGYSGGGNALGNNGILNRLNIRIYLGKTAKIFSSLLSDNADFTHISASPKKGIFAKVNPSAYLRETKALFLSKLKDVFRIG